MYKELEMSMGWTSVLKTCLQYNLQAGPAKAPAISSSGPGAHSNVIGGAVPRIEEIVKDLMGPVLA